MAFGKLTRRTSRRPSPSNSSVTLLKGIGEDASRETDITRRDDRRPRIPELKKIEKIDWEIPRKILHSSIGKVSVKAFEATIIYFIGFFVVPLYTRGITARPVTLILSGALMLIGASDILRFQNSVFEKLYERVFGFLMRDSEKVRRNSLVLSKICWSFVFLA
jgi:diacylglycerol kinase (CTP)